MFQILCAIEFDEHVCIFSCGRKIYAKKTMPCFVAISFFRESIFDLVEHVMREELYQNIRKDHFYAVNSEKVSRKHFCTVKCKNNGNIFRKSLDLMSFRDKELNLRIISNVQIILLLVQKLDESLYLDLFSW